MGYDLLNEPWPGTGWQACANTEGCPAFDRDKLTAVLTSASTARSASATRTGIVWYEPNVLFNFGPKSHHGAIGAAGRAELPRLLPRRAGPRRRRPGDAARGTAAATRWSGCRS